MKFCEKKYQINLGQLWKFLVILAVFSPQNHLVSQMVNPYEKDSISQFELSIHKTQFNKNTEPELSIQDKLPGLQIITKSGMPNEGAYINWRGIHSLIATNIPLIVLNGVPYFANEDISPIVNGYSRSLLSAFNVEDIRSISILKGSEASIYGSLGSNGVILIETEQATSDNLETKITFSGKYGYHFPNRSIPTLGSDAYKNYLQDIGMTRYSSPASLVADYPFLENTPNFYSYLFDSQSDWVSMIQSPAFVTDNVFRVEGGDAIAKYNLSFGYTSNAGVIGNTRSDRYNTLINTNITVSRKVDIFTNVGLAYTTGKLMEQGMSDATNPMLAASFAMPMISPYKKESDGNVLNRHAAYNEWNTNKNPTFAYDNVSNPLAIVNTIDARDKIYDANIRLGLNYRPSQFLTLTGTFNLNLNYTEEGIFIPGVTQRAIIPQYYGVGFNTVRKGVIQSKAYYYGLRGSYQRVFEDVHSINALAGVNYVGRKSEFDFASGYNTSNDYFSSLNYVTEHRRITGKNTEWKWLNYYVKGEYTFNNLLMADVNLAIDGSSVSGIHAPRFGLFPSLRLSTLVANYDFLPDFVDILNVYAEVARTGNSRFSSNYAKNFYQNSNLFNLGTIVRDNVPNTKLQWEKNDQLEAGVEFSLWKMLDLQVSLFTANAHDLLVNRNISGVYGSHEYYDNTGAVRTNGMEATFNIKAINTKEITWNLGASLAAAHSKITHLGNSDELLISLNQYNNDDAFIIMREGESPFQFYGYKTQGVYATSEDATASGLMNIYGKPYQGGDVIFVNADDTDNAINAKDKVLLGSATPDFFGSIHTAFRYKTFMLSADFGYSVGNQAYNAMRRQLESMGNFYNQSIAVMNRWQIEGQKTSIPRAAYGDPAGNNLFSDRWIEDASYLKLRNLTLQYEFGNLYHIFQGGKLYVSGTNLWTLTNYLGGDPEFAYSNTAYMQGIDYAKISRPKTIQFGFQLFF